MKNFSCIVLVWMGLFLFVSNNNAQPFSLNGYSYFSGNDCITLTSSGGGQYGSAWHYYMINLNENFNVVFDAYFGWNNGNGADGLVFVFQNECFNTGSSGGGIGYEFINPSLAVEFDTYENSVNNPENGGILWSDPAYDHVGIQKNGSGDHGNPAYNCAGPVQASSTSQNIEDGAYHTIEIDWNAGTNTLSVYFDGVFRLSYTNNIVNNIFGGDPLVYWGFTAATGGYYNEHTVCVSTPELPDATICAGESVYYELPEGAESYSWSPTTGVSNPNSNATYLSPTTTTLYTITVGDACGNYITDDVLITVTQPVADAGPDVDFCAGEVVTLTANGGVSYLWNTGQASQTINVTPTTTTTYTVTVTDQNGCTDTDDVTVNIGTLSVSVGGTDPSCNGVCDATATVTINGGTGTVNCFWDNGGGTNLTATDLCGGTTYTVLVSDDVGCTGTGSYTPTDPPAIIISTSGIDPACGNNNGQVSVNASGGTGTLTYLWDDDNNSTVTVVTDLYAGTYTVTVTDANGCTAVMSQSISDIGAPTISVTYNDILCAGGNDGDATVTVNGGQSPFDYLWDNGQNTSTATGLIAGTYSVTVTDVNGCTAILTVTISEPPELISTISGTDLLCFGDADGTANLEVTGGTTGYTYTWNPPAATQNLSGLSGGTYDVTVTDANGCTAINTITLTEPPLLTSTISGTDALCAGDEAGTVDVEVDGGTPPYTYFWQPTDETSEDINGLPEGDYTVLITDDNGCTTTNSITIDEPYPVVTQMSGTDLLCFSDVSGGSAGVDATGGTQPYIYEWSNGESTQTITNIGADTYTVTVTDQNNCSATDNITITEPPELIVNIPEPDWICIGETVTLIVNASGGTPDYNYEWSNGTMEQSNNVSPLVTTYYSIITTDVNGCLANANITVNVYGPLVLDIFPNDTICPGETAVINSSYDGGMGAPYTLTLDGTTVIQTPYTVSPDVTTVYNVCVTDNCSTPQACDELEVVVMDLPPVDFIADIYEGCEPLTVSFNETNTHLGQTYLWNFGDPWGSTTGTGKYPVHTFDNAGTYDVTCMVIDIYGCTNTWTWYEMINVYPNPVASFLPYPQVATILKPEIFFDNTSSTFYVSNWTFGDGDISNEIHPQHHYDNWGTYTVQLAVETEHGCVDTAWTEVVIQDIITFYAPTAFSPDFDQMNGLFSPIGHGIDPDYWNLMIYDRWGEKVWETNVYDVDEETGQVNHGWDGTIKNRNIGETAVYSWLVVYRDVTGAEHQEAGLVTLIR